MTVEVVETPAEEWTLSLRIPGWAHGSTVEGEPVAAGGYAGVSRQWQPGDRVVLELDVRPRLTAPSPLIDAVRGCLAIERGPLVYCLEEVDLPQQADLADVRVAPERSVSDGSPLEQLGGFPGVLVAGRVTELDGWRQVEYLDLRELPAEGPKAHPASLLAVPYFAWANRGAGAMRVWIPDSD